MENKIKELINKLPEYKQVLYKEKLENIKKKKALELNEVSKSLIQKEVKANFITALPYLLRELKGDLAKLNENADYKAEVNTKLSEIEVEVNRYNKELGNYKTKADEKFKSLATSKSLTEVRSDLGETNTNIKRIVVVLTEEEQKIASVNTRVDSLESRAKQIAASIPPRVLLKAGKNVSIDTKTTADLVTYEISLADFEIKYKGPIGPGGSGAKTFLELSDTPDSYSNMGGRIVQVKSDGSGLEFVVAGAASNLVTSVNGLTGAVVLGTNDIAEGTSNFYFNTRRFVGTGGASVSVNGLTITIFSATAAGLVTSVNGATGAVVLDTDDVGEGSSNFYYTEARFTTSFGTKNTNNLTEGSSNFYYTEGRFTTSLGTKTTNNLTEGTSNFYYLPTRFVGTGGVSVSINGLTITIFGLSSAINTNQVAEGTSNFYYTESRFNTSLAAKTTNDLAEGTSNFYFVPTNFVGTGGASVSVNGRTVTIFGLSSAINTNQVSEGTSNFYWRIDRLAASNGVSIVRNGVTATIRGQIVSKSTHIPGATVGDYVGMFFTDRAVTVQKQSAVVTGTSPTVNFSILHHTSRNNAGIELITGGVTVTSQTTGTISTSFNAAGITTNSFVWLKVNSAGTPGVSSLEVTLIFTED